MNESPNYGDDSPGVRKMGKHVLLYRGFVINERFATNGLISYQEVLAKRDQSRLSTPRLLDLPAARCQ